jgi:hypothetical protein
MRSIVLLLSAVALYASEHGFVLCEIAPGQLQLSENRSPVFVYHFDARQADGSSPGYRRSDYLHPVYTPDGVIVTDDFPPEHPHHRGISWMWPAVIVDGKKYDLWKMVGIGQRPLRWTARQAGAHRAHLGVENGWFVGERLVVKEAVDIVVHAASRRERSFDLALTFEAAGSSVRLEGDNPNFGKGYGGLAFRLAPSESTLLRTDNGVESRDSDMVPHRWAELSGLFGGKPAAVRVEIDPSTAGFPDGWCLRHYGFLGVNYPGLKPVVLERGHPLTMRFHITISD